MVYGIDGEFGGRGNVLSITCRPREPFRGSNPTLTANVKSIAYKKASISVGNRGQYARGFAQVPHAVERLSVPPPGGRRMRRGHAPIRGTMIRVLVEVLIRSQIIIVMPYVSGSQL
jgi:hypothetical protein